MITATLVQLVDIGGPHAEPLHARPGFRPFRHAEAVDAGFVDFAGAEAGREVGRVGAVDDGGLGGEEVGGRGAGRGRLRGGGEGGGARFRVVVVVVVAEDGVRGREVAGVAFDADFEFGEGHEEEAAECGAEEGAVHGLESAVGGRVDVEAAWAEQFHRILPGCVADAHRKDFGSVAEYPRTQPEVLQVVLFRHLLYAWT